MTMILNEVKQAENLIATGEIGSKPSAALFLLGRYYSQKEHSDSRETAYKLNAFMQKHEKNYNPALWENTIEKISKKAVKFPLRELNAIGITQSELDCINNLHNSKYEKLLFTMLCHAKLYNMVSEQNNGWVNTKIPELFRLARVTVKYRADKFLILNDLEAAGLISFSNQNDNLNLQVNFVDMNSEPVLYIEDFRELGYEYLNYLGDGTYFRCSLCNRLHKKSGKRALYCTDCKHKKQLEWQRSSMKKRRIQ